MEIFRKRYQGPVTAIPGLPAWESELLCARGIHTPEKAEKFLRPRIEDLHDPLRMPDMARTLALIRETIAAGERILVYGDYDVDGVCAAAILLETLLEEGAKASFHIPSRHQDGYGLNEKAIREFAEKQVRLLITVDCGISNVREVRLAKKLGMKVIVTDHHEIPEELPPADAVMDPHQEGCGYPFPHLCGAGVALKICQAMQGRAGLEKRIEIAALATVADIVPLVDENRVIVREGLRRMPGTLRPGLRALMQKAGVGEALTSEDIGFRLGPRINAAGRLGDAKQAATLLMTGKPEKAESLAASLEENNRRRQEMERAILAEASALLSDQADLGQDRALVLSGEGWNPGLIGLVAGKICEKMYLPTIVLSRKGDGEAVGSCRSIPGVNIFRMLGFCEDLLIRFGGHEQAAGLTIAEEKIPAFRKRLNRVIRENADPACFQRIREYDSLLTLDQVTLEMIDRLESLEPTGFGNPPPVFLCEGAELQEARRVGRDQSHLKIALLQGDALRGGIGFGLGEMADQGWTRVDALFRPSRNEFNGRVTAQLQVSAMRRAEAGAR